jgi:hypothetical protein
VGNRSQGVLRDNSHLKDRHHWKEEQEREMRVGTGPVGERHRQANKELHICGHYSIIWLLLIIIYPTWSLILKII